MTRLLFIAAALYNFAWVAILLTWPASILRKTPPLFAPMVALIGVVGLAFAVCAWKPRRWLVGVTIIAKISGPVTFLAAVPLGYVAWNQWWMPVLNDLIWLPPLVAIWRRERHL